jgi:hypothetical protein
MYEYKMLERDQLRDRRDLRNVHVDDANGNWMGLT